MTSNDARHLAGAGLASPKPKASDARRPAPISREGSCFRPEGEALRVHGVGLARRRGRARVATDRDVGRDEQTR